MPNALLSERCPRLGQRAENIFEIAIATTLSLLAGSTVISQKKPSGSDPALPSDEQPRQLPRRRSQGKSSLVQAQETAREQVELQALEKASEKEKEKKQPRDKR